MAKISRKKIQKAYNKKHYLISKNEVAVASRLSEVNKRIKAVTKEYGKDSWAVKELNSKLSNLNTFTRRGNLKLKRGMTEVELIAVDKATRTFLKRKTSTVRGIKEVSKKQIENLSAELNMNVKDVDKKLTKKDIENLYSAFGDESLGYLIKNYNVSASEVIALIAESIEKRYSKDKFIDLISKHVGGEAITNDVNLSKGLETLYNKFIS